MRQPLPNSVKTIRYYSFEDCDGLISVTILDGVTTMGGGVFSRCGNLNSVIIPDSVIDIGNNLFYDCPNFSDIYYTGSESDWNNISMGSNEELTNVNIHFNYGKPVAGDLSGDGEIAVDDVIYVLKYVVGDVALTEEQVANVDLSGDGKLTILDAIMIQRLVLQMD
ncbi:MAG: leucine-rich repeat protein [Acutalibacteraceae bacterium]|nr:leucine-rich repeat protein [Acutalibacteraceae bacterium]